MNFLNLSLVQRVISHELIGGASIIFAGGLFANLFNFLFQLFMSRNLSLADWGAFSSLNSLLTLSTLPIGALLPTIVYFSAFYFAKGELDKVSGLFFKITKPATAIGLFILILYILFQKPIAAFLNISQSTLVIPVALSVFIVFASVATMPLLQAKLSFKFITLLTFLSALFKLLVGVGLVMAGFSVAGAMWGYFIAALIPFVGSFFDLKFLLRKKITTSKISLNSLFSYGIPTMLATLGLTSLINTDIIIVKHFLDPDTAGIYATLSLVGRIIFFFSAPIATVMFPLIAQKHARAENFHSTFRLSMLLVLLCSVAITIFYFLFPEFSMHVFSQKEESLVGVPYVGLFGIFIALYALLTVLVNFYLSIKKTKVFIPMLVGALAQAVLLWFYHDTFEMIIGISLGITSLLLASLLLYYWKLYGSQKT